METTERDPDVPRGKEDERGVTRRLRIGGAPKEGRVYGLRRVPRNLAAGILMMGVLIWFFAGISGNPLEFLVMLAVIVAIFWFVIWALAKTPIRPRFDQRWKPKRKIDPLCTEGWKEVAAELGTTVSPGRLPRIDGVVDGVPVRVAYFQRGSARTVVVARLRLATASRLLAFPRRAEFHTKETVETGDRDFDRAWHVQCADPATVKRRLGSEARLLISIAEPESLEVAKGSVVLRRKGFVDDPARLRDMVRAAMSLAR